MKGNRFLITGGTGSFGHAMISYLLEQGAGEVRILSRDEKKQNDMRMDFCDDRLRFYIGDVRDADCVAIACEGVDFCFHAAALKQVPSCEFFPLEAVKTNILGANNVINGALRAGVKSCVFLSTDKAVYPINAMGLSKGLMEKLVVAGSRAADIRGQTAMNVTRYGNVMGSRGSVIPLFLERARRGLSLQLTNPDMTRFLMSLGDSVKLVAKAWDSTSSGNIFVRKSPSCTLLTLAEAIIDLTNSASKIELIGVRHGEKLHETLVSAEEMVRCEDLGDYFVVRMDERDLNYQPFESKGKVGPEIMAKPYDSESTNILGVEDVKKLLVKTFGYSLNV